MNLADGDLYLRLVLSAAPGVSVVGEDLGCVPDYVRPNMRQLDIPGFKIPHWEIKPDGSIILGKEYHECSFAAFGTHDFETLMQTWNDSYAKIERARKLNLWMGAFPKLPPIRNRNTSSRKRKTARLLKWFADYCGMQPETWMSYWNLEIKTAMYRALFRSKSRYSAILWPALFDINKRLNIPGTTGGTNWRERMPFKAVEACSMPQTAWLRSIIDDSDRTPLQGKTPSTHSKASSKRIFPKVTVNNERFLKRMLMWPNGKSL